MTGLEWISPFVGAGSRKASAEVGTDQASGASWVVLSKPVDDRPEIAVDCDRATGVVEEAPLDEADSETDEFAVDLP